MTHRVHSLVVVLKSDLRDDDAEHVANAIREFGSVLSVKPVVADFVSNMAEDRAKAEFRAKLVNVGLLEKTVGLE
jgi:hypothetical protein